jgi:hypothetical protein
VTKGPRDQPIKGGCCKEEKKGVRGFAGRVDECYTSARGGREVNEGGRANEQRQCEVEVEPWKWM